MTDQDRKQRSSRRDIVFVFVLALACCVAWQLRALLLMLYVCGLFAVVLAPVVQRVAALRVSHWQPFKRIAVLVLPLAAAGLLVLFAALAVPPVARDLAEFSKEMPARTPLLMEKLRNIPFADRIDADALNAHVQEWAGKAAAYTLSSLKNGAGALFRIAMGFILIIYFILEGDGAYRWFLSFFPASNRERLDSTLRRAELRMGQWLLGQGSLMLILGLCSTVVYLALGVRYAYALGVLTGLLNIVPILGAALCVALALLVAALDSWGRVVGVAVFYLVYLQVENSFLVPRIMKSRVGLPSLAILIALLLGSELGGIVGAMVSVPTAVLVAELVDEYLVNRDPA
ncbi:MAG TPA: AI-2E family transporter [Terracidiphilus sp.]|jgi:predicted PurR-regulated permease PerM|nr:AI-2E family transporter [Terracidiphilus sp.]